MTHFFFDANSKCLDFINTELVERDIRVDLIGDFKGLVKWLRQARYLSKGSAEQVRERWDGRSEGVHLLKEAAGVRQLIRGMVEKMAAGEALEKNVVDQVNALLMRGHGYVQLVRTEGGYLLQPQVDLDQPVNLIRPIVESAGRLLSERDPVRVKKCQNPACIHYFYDISKNRTRRWCRMNVCGNRMKAAAYYQRQKKKKEG